MDLISALDLLIGYLSKDDLFVGRIIEVKKIKYIPNGKELGERAIFSTYKTSTERVRTALLYKMDDGYFDLKTKQTYQAIKKTRKKMRLNKKKLLFVCENGKKLNLDTEDSYSSRLFFLS